jgi:FixJ family two-component response regulator
VIGSIPVTASTIPQPEGKRGSAAFAEGYSVKDVASSSNLSPKTVETHKYNIMEKLGASSVLN